MSRSQLRATLILQVRAGQLTAEQAAQQLGISRQRYYTWEKRALQAMLSAVEDQPKGRPKRKQDPEKQTLLDRVKELEAQVQLFQEKEQLRQKLKQIRAEPDRKKNAT
ncbi:MAG TPA: helix-turn-helix domain-containing protein [Terriglobia bacterium]|nr:helix-turn-helix domain-containing protein [Terriglobia bacterium]